MRRAEDPEFTINPNRFDSLAATRSSNARVASAMSRVGLSRMTATTASISRSSCTAPAGGSFMSESSPQVQAPRRSPLGGIV